MKKVSLIIFFLVLVIVLAACGAANETANNGTASNETATKDQTAEESKKELTIGATAGPYSDMVSKAIKPILEKKGYTVNVVEFSDYVQPNLALANGSIDANLFQHVIYMKKFAEDKGLELSNVIIVPTAPMGLYSNKFNSIEEITDGSTLTIANDPTNLARTLLLLQNAGLIKMNENIDPLQASEKDVTENPKNLKLVPIEAAQLPRAVESTDIAAVPGNFALAAGMDLLTALQLEEMSEQYMNQVVVNTKDLDATFTKDIKEAVESAEFEQTIDEQFKGFFKPDWMRNR